MQVIIVETCLRGSYYFRSIEVAWIVPFVHLLQGRGLPPRQKAPVMAQSIARGETLFCFLGLESLRIITELFSQDAHLFFDLSP